MLVIDVAVTFFLGWPAILMVFAAGLAALPGSGVSLLVLTMSDVSIKCCFY